MPKCTFDPATREGEHAVLVTHTAVVGGAIHGEPVCFDHRRLVRRFKIGRPGRHAQHAQTVHISFVVPGKRNGSSYRADPTDHTYYTIESETGAVIYDSRTEVPCNMAKFAATRERFVKQWQDSGYTVVAEDAA